MLLRGSIIDGTCDAESKGEELLVQGSSSSKMVHESSEGKVLHIQDDSSKNMFSESNNTEVFPSIGEHPTEITDKELLLPAKDSIAKDSITNDPVVKSTEDYEYSSDEEITLAKLAKPVAPHLLAAC